MIKTILLNLPMYLIIFSLNQSLFAQLIKSDDFKFKNDYWYWRSDGNQSIPSVANGQLHLNLINPHDSGYCNTEIYDPIDAAYSPGTQVRIRLKCSTQDNSHIGSRGWGFWDGDNIGDSLLYGFDVAWMMQQRSGISDPNFDWFHYGVDGNDLVNKQILNLENVIDETQWHTYKIIWRSDSTFLFIDDLQYFVSTENLPDQKMRVDLWIDNRVISIADPSQSIIEKSAGSEMFVDFIEVSGVDGPSIPRIADGNILLWDSPNTYPDGHNDFLWKNYDFHIPKEGEALIFITGDAENYGQNNDDDLKVIIDGNDFGWDNSNSLNGEILKGSGASISIPINLTAGNHNLELHSDITPFLKDVMILYSENGQITMDSTFNEIPSTEDGLWKTINFTSSHMSEMTFLISGSGYNGDKIRIEIDNKDYLWSGENAINGDELLGTPKTVVINDTLTAGSHTLKIYKIGSPKLYNIASYIVKLSFLDIRVMLEGSYAGGNVMISNISQNITFPKIQPYSASPWDYSGTEKIEVVPTNIIDWIFIELRDDLLNSVNTYQRAAFLTNSGNIIDLDGGDIKFSGIESGNYYITLYHRNHLSITSSETIFIE